MSSSETKDPESFDKLVVSFIINYTVILNFNVNFRIKSKSCYVVIKYLK
jgi:hypothetical protein